MNTTTNTRGVSEAMWQAVDRMIVDAWKLGGCEKTPDMLVMRKRYDDAIAALSAPEPAAQGEAVSTDDIEAMRSAAMTIKHNKESWFPMTDRRLRRAALALLARRPAPPAQPAAQGEAVAEWQRKCPDYPNCPNLGCPCEPRETVDSIVPDDAHHAFVVGPSTHMHVRLSQKGFDLARAAFGTASAEDDARVYRTIQAYIHAASPAPSEGGKGVDRG